MATFNVSLPDFTITSTADAYATQYDGSGNILDGTITTHPTTVTKEFTYSSLPSGAVISPAVTLTYRAMYPSKYSNSDTLTAQGSSMTMSRTSAATVTSQALDGLNDNTKAVNATISGNKIRVTFVYTYAPTVVFGRRSESNTAMVRVSVSGTYSDSVSAPSAPTTLKINKTTVETGKNYQLSWSGAEAGSNNAITGYEIQSRSAVNGGSYGSWAAVTTVGSSAAAYTRTASISSFGATSETVQYRIRTVGTTSDTNYKYSPWTTFPESVNITPAADPDDPDDTDPGGGDDEGGGGDGGGGGGSGINARAKQGEAVSLNNLPPYLTVRIWKRKA